MEIKDILSPVSTKNAVRGTSKKRILETLSELAASAANGVEYEVILKSLTSRERMGSTGIGQGIALPHGRLPGMKRPVAVAITCDPPVEFDAIDNKPVDIFFALLVPENENENHLKVLSTVASKLNDRNTVRKLRKAMSDSALYEALV